MHIDLNLEPNSWSNLCPGDLSVRCPEVHRSDLEPALVLAQSAAKNWSRTPLTERAQCLKKAQQEILQAKDQLAHGISLETGKPIKEALGELDGVIAKIDLTLEDALRYCTPEIPPNTPHPAQIRHLARGPAAVIAPFNFPLHLGHGAATAYLASGNPVLFKPSPLCAAVAGEYGKIMQRSFPLGVFQLVQGGSETAKTLCLDPRIRAVCFTGSAQAGRSLAQTLAHDFSKDLALELGGKNAVLVYEDADLELAATAVAQATCLTTGQRCNATSRLIIHQSIQDKFLEILLIAFKIYQPGAPLDPATTLGPLISERSLARYKNLIQDTTGTWIKPGLIIPEVAKKSGYYVQPAIVLNPTHPSLTQEECFAPILSVLTARNHEEMLQLHQQTPYGLTTSIFTRSAQLFHAVADELYIGNIYANLPTTFSPSTLPFGGLGDSGNGRPAGRGFIRFTTAEQTTQTAQNGFA